MHAIVAILMLLAQPMSLPLPATSLDAGSTAAAGVGFLQEMGQAAQEEPCLAPEGRAELESKLAFLKRAEAAFLFSHRSTTEVKERIRAVERQLARLEEEPLEPAEVSIEDRIQELESERRFLERAEAAFFHSHRSTTEVKQRIVAVEQCLSELRKKLSREEERTKSRACPEPAPPVALGG